MKKLPWFRMYTEARADKKLAILTDRQFRIWFNLLALAAEQADRGTIPSMARALLAIEVSDGDVETLKHTVEALTRLHIITIDNGAITFVHFEERQHDKPSDLPEATRLRKKESRARQREGRHALSRDMSRDVTLSHATSRPVTPLDSTNTQNSVIVNSTNTVENEGSHALSEHKSRDVTLSHAQEEKRREENNVKTTTLTSSSKKPTARKIGLPDGFVFSERVRSWAHIELKLDDATIEREQAKFLDHAETHGPKYVSWDAAARSWLRRASEGTFGPVNGARVVARNGRDIGMSNDALEAYARGER